MSKLAPHHTKRQCKPNSLVNAYNRANELVSETYGGSRELRAQPAIQTIEYEVLVTGLTTVVGVLLEALEATRVLDKSISSRQVVALLSALRT